MKQILLWGSLGVLVLGLVGFGLWIYSLPPTPSATRAPPIAEDEVGATLASLQPRNRERPLMAIVGINDATETTDYLMPAGIELRSGVDEISLALVSDAWSRTYRSRAVTFARSGGVIATRGGMRILPDEVATGWPTGRLIPTVAGRPADALDQALRAIADRYGARTAEVVAMQLEYPRPIAP